MPRSRIIWCGLLAGAIAIAVNIILLDLADRVGIVTARGGLLRLMKLWLTEPLIKIGASNLWTNLNLPEADTPLFKTVFKFTVGLIMALFYALLLEPRLAGRAITKGIVYAVLLWLLNAFGVLLVLEEGVAGSRYLTPVGLAYFAGAHTAFFIVLALLYERCAKSRKADMATQR